MPDRDRKDGLTRTRVDEIGASMDAYRERLDARYRRVVRFVIGAVVVAALALLGDLWLLRESSHQATMNTAALCALRGDLEQRVKSSTDFLKTHPLGAFGVPAAAIRVTVDGQRRTIVALSVLDCR